MKKFLSLILSLAFVAALAGCGGGAGSEGSAPAADSGDTINFIIATVDPDGSASVKNLVKLEEYVEEATDGRVDIQISPNGILGGERELFESVQLGSIQMALGATSNLANLEEKFAILEVPFLFDSNEAVWAAYDGELGDLYNEWLAEYDYIAVSIDSYGWRALSNSVRPVDSPDDLKGMKIRVMEVPMYIDAFTQMGANPTPMSYNEVYTGLQQGTIDGQDNTALLTYEAGFYEVQTNFTDLNHTMCNIISLMNKTYYDSLPEDIRQAIIEGVKIFSEGVRADTAAAAEDAMSIMEESGVEITRLTDEQRDAFKEMVAPLHEQYRGIVGDEVMDLVLSYNK